MRFFYFVKHQGGVTLDVHQKIVKIMGDAAGEGAQRFKALGLLKLNFQFATLFFGFFAVAYVDNKAP